jgi:hypothetical protein
MAKTAKRTAQGRKLDPKRNIVPDQLDLRDRPYLPTLLAPPDVEFAPKLKLRCSTRGGRTRAPGLRWRPS